MTNKEAYKLIESCLEYDKDMSEYPERYDMALQIARGALKKERTNSFVDIRNEALNDSEKEGIDKLFDMMLSLRQQIQLRNSFEKEMSRNEMPNGAKLCPFCGGEAEVTDEDSYGFSNGDWMVCCNECHAYLGFDSQYETPQEAIEAWNRRVE